MAAKPLVIAAVATGLLVLSVGLDLAFNSVVQVRAAPVGEPLRLVGESEIDARSYARPAPPSPTFRMNGSDTLAVEITLQNAYPWGVTRAFTLTRDGCYDGATLLGSVRVSAPGNGEGKAVAELAAATLLREYGMIFPKGPEGTSGDAVQPVHLQVCRGNARGEVVTASFGIEEVAR